MFQWGPRCDSEAAQRHTHREEQVREHSGMYPRRLLHVLWGSTGFAARPRSPYAPTVNRLTKPWPTSSATTMPSAAAIPIRLLQLSAVPRATTGPSSARASKQTWASTDRSTQQSSESSVTWTEIGRSTKIAATSWVCISPVRPDCRRGSVGTSPVLRVSLSACCRPLLLPAVV